SRAQSLTICELADAAIATCGDARIAFTSPLSLRITISVPDASIASSAPRHRANAWQYDARSTASASGSSRDARVHSSAATPVRYAGLSDTNDPRAPQIARVFPIAEVLVGIRRVRERRWSLALLE